MRRLGRSCRAILPSVASRAGAAPRHVAFHPTKPFAYVINELDSTMTTYAFDPDKGGLKPLQILPTGAAQQHTGNNTGAEVCVAPTSGVSLRIEPRPRQHRAIFAIDAQTGTLRVGRLGTDAQGHAPRYFGLDPSGTELYAANQNSDTIVIFRVDPATGKLAATGQVVKAGSPSTIVFRSGAHIA